MGKGTIISHIGDGQYNLTVNYYRELYEKTIAALTEKISDLETQIYTVLEVGSEEYNLAKLELAAFKKRKQVLEDSFPEDQAIQAWCADLTENLSGEVKTIEVPGESGNIQIYPGHTSATWNETAGQLVPTVSQGAAQAFYNIAMLPGWQKWKPTFRYGTITSIDSGSDECNVTLEDIRSSQQDLAVNQSSNLSGVPIEYMTCNSAAFEVGDTVLIEFEGQDWANPKVIGFKEEPKPCGSYLYIELNAYSTTRGFAYALDFVVIWDIENNEAASNVTLNTGELVTSWPVRKNEISLYLDGKNKTGSKAVSQSSTVNVNISPFGYRETIQTSSTCTEYFPSSSTCRKKTNTYESTCTQLSPAYVGKGYEIIEYAGESTEYQICGGPYYCDTVQVLSELENEYSFDFKLSSLTYDTTKQFEGLIKTATFGNGYWNGNTDVAYLGKNPYEYYALSHRRHTFKFGSTEYATEYESENNYEPGGAPVIGTQINGLICENTVVKESEWVYLLDSVYGTEKKPYTFFLIVKDCLRIETTVPTKYTALNPDLGGTLNFCRRESDNAWLPWWSDDPPWIAEDDIVTYSGEPPEIIAFSAEYDSDPRENSPFDAVINDALSETLTDTIQAMMNFMHRQTPVDNFILYNTEIKFLG